MQALAKANIPYSAVSIDNMAVTSASTAVTAGQVDAAVISQPLTGLDLATGKVRVLATGAGYLQTIGYLTASDAALSNPQKAAALSDFITRFYKASAILRKDPTLAAQTYVKTYGVTLPVAERPWRRSRRSARPSRRPSSPTSRTRRTRSSKLGLIPSHLNVKSIFDLPFNKAVAKASGLQS